MDSRHGLPTQGGAPKGLIGRMLGRLMNGMHRRGHRRVLDGLRGLSPSDIVDIGCGGGVVVRELGRLFPKAVITGIDHSPDMVALSRRVNRRGVRTGRIRIIRASAGELPLEPASVALVTAFETIQYWPDHFQALAEIRRVLCPGGVFFLVNRFPPEGSPWRRRLPITDEAAYRRLLETAGFSVQSMDQALRKGWICIRCTNSS